MDEVKAKASAAAQAAKAKLEEEARHRADRKKADAEAEAERARQAAADRDAAFQRAQRECPLPVQPDQPNLPGGLKLFNDEFLVTVGKDWGWSSQQLTLTTHRVIWSHGRLTKDQKIEYLTDIRDVRYHKPLIGFGNLILETAGGRSIEGLPAASNGSQVRDRLLALIHYARQRSQTSGAPPAPAAPASTPPDKFEQLKRLGELKAQGVLSEAEFESEKAKLLQSS